MKEYLCLLRPKKELDDKFLTSQVQDQTMASRQARKSQPAAQASESEDENSQQSSQEADMHVLKAARNVVSTVRNLEHSFDLRILT